jgi:molybdenum cofactor cytidylyltransferase
MISAVVLAAGRSQRMGRPKMTLPWGSTTVIGRVVQVLGQAGVDDILVVTGGAHAEVETVLLGSPARLVFNPRFTEGGMADSLQVGLAHLPEATEAALVALGDQPQIQPEVVIALVARYLEDRPPLVVPSYAMRRGHPWIVARSLWTFVQSLGPSQTLRDLLHSQAELVAYLAVDTDSVLADLDTPSDYERERPIEPDSNPPGLG